MSKNISTNNNFLNSNDVNVNAQTKQMIDNSKVVNNMINFEKSESFKQAVQSGHIVVNAPLMVANRNNDSEDETDSDTDELDSQSISEQEINTNKVTDNNLGIQSNNNFEPTTSKQIGTNSNKEDLFTKFYNEAVAHISACYSKNQMMPFVAKKLFHGNEEEILSPHDQAHDYINSGESESFYLRYLEASIRLGNDAEEACCTYAQSKIEEIEFEENDNSDVASEDEDTELEEDEDDDDDINYEQWQRANEETKRKLTKEQFLNWEVFHALRKQWIVYLTKIYHNTPAICPEKPFPGLEFCSDVDYSGNFMEDASFIKPANYNIMGLEEIKLVKVLKQAQHKWEIIGDKVGKRVIIADRTNGDTKMKEYQRPKHNKTESDKGLKAIIEDQEMSDAPEIRSKPLGDYPHSAPFVNNQEIEVDVDLEAEKMNKLIEKIMQEQEAKRRSSISDKVDHDLLMKMENGEISNQYLQIKEFDIDDAIEHFVCQSIVFGRDRENLIELYSWCKLLANDKSKQNKKEEIECDRIAPYLKSVQVLSDLGLTGFDQEKKEFSISDRAHSHLIETLQMCQQISVKTHEDVTKCGSVSKYHICRGLASLLGVVIKNVFVDPQLSLLYCDQANKNRLKDNLLKIVEFTNTTYNLISDNISCPGLNNVASALSKLKPTEECLPDYLIDQADINIVKVNLCHDYMKDEKASETDDGSSSKSGLIFALNQHHDYLIEVHHEEWNKNEVSWLPKDTAYDFKIRRFLMSLHDDGENILIQEPNSLSSNETISTSIVLEEDHETIKNTRPPPMINQNIKTEKTIQIKRAEIPADTVEPPSIIRILDRLSETLQLDTQELEMEIKQMESKLFNVNGFSRAQTENLLRKVKSIKLSTVIYNVQMCSNPNSLGSSSSVDSVSEDISKLFYNENKEQRNKYSDRTGRNDEATKYLSDHMPALDDVSWKFLQKNKFLDWKWREKLDNKLGRIGAYYESSNGFVFGEFLCNDPLKFKTLHYNMAITNFSLKSEEENLIFLFLGYHALKRCLNSRENQDHIKPLTSDQWKIIVSRWYSRSVLVHYEINEHYDIIESRLFPIVRKTHKKESTKRSFVKVVAKRLSLKGLEGWPKFDVYKGKEESWFVITYCDVDCKEISKQMRNKQSCLFLNEKGRTKPVNLGRDSVELEKWLDKVPILFNRS